MTVKEEVTFEPSELEETDRESSETDTAAHAGAGDAGSEGAMASNDSFVRVATFTGLLGCGRFFGGRLLDFFSVFRSRDR